MAKDSSFDIVSQVDLQTMDDAVNVAAKEVANRYDLKGLAIELVFNRNEESISLLAPSDFHVEMIVQILIQKISKKGLDPKVIREKKREKASGDKVRVTYEVVTGIDKELAKIIAKDIKDLKLKVQPAIQEDQLRVSSAKIDDLQAVIAELKRKEYPAPLQFVNYR